MLSFIGSLDERNRMRLARSAALFEPGLDGLATAQSQQESIFALAQPLVTALFVQRARAFESGPHFLAALHGSVIDPVVDDLIADPTGTQALVPRAISSGQLAAHVWLGEDLDRLTRLIATLAQAPRTRVRRALFMLLPALLLAFRRVTSEMGVRGDDLPALLERERSAILACVDERVLSVLLDDQPSGPQRVAEWIGLGLTPARLGGARARRQSRAFGPATVRGSWRIPFKAFVQILRGRRR